MRCVCIPLEVLAVSIGATRLLENASFVAYNRIRTKRDLYLMVVVSVTLPIVEVEGDRVSAARKFSLASIDELSPQAQATLLCLWRVASMHLLSALLESRHCIYY